jgi:maltooligosyltrehalose trehalohydrolase
MGDGTSLRLLANLSHQAIPAQSPGTGTKLWGGDLSGALSPWSVHWHIG